MLKGKKMSEKVTVVVKKIPQLKKLCEVYGLSSDEYLRKLLKGNYTSYIFHIQCILYPEDINNIKLHYDEIYKSHSIIEERFFYRMDRYKDLKNKLLKIAEENEQIAKLIKEAKLAYEYNKIVQEIEKITIYEMIERCDNIYINKYYESIENNDFGFLEKCGALICSTDYNPIIPF